MNPSNANLRKAEGQFQTAALQYITAIEPHRDKMESDDCKFYLTLISVVSIAVLEGAKSPAALFSTIELAVAKIGIPKEAFEAHAHFTTAMIKVMAIRHQNNSPR